MNVEQAIICIKSGNVLLTNTDTVPGLSCDASNAEAVAKIIALKNRPSEKTNFIILVSNDAQINKILPDVPDMAWDLMDFATTPLTLILDGAKNLAGNCVAQDGSIAIRYIKNGPLKDLISRLNKPIVSTSANISGEKSPVKMEDVDPRISEAVDCIWDCDMQSTGQASSIIKLKANGEFNFIRK